MSRGNVWGPVDATGGPIDEVFVALRQKFPDLWIERLSVTHPGDDDNVWYLGRESAVLELQIDSMPDGAPPFLLESDTGRARTESVREAVETLSDWLAT